MYLYLSLRVEQENQAVSSSDQLRVLYQWWKELKPELKSKIQEQKAQIVITGYASSTGTERYNQQLGNKRAKHVAEMLMYKIGIHLNGDIPVFDVLYSYE